MTKPSTPLTIVSSPAREIDAADDVAAGAMADEYHLGVGEARRRMQRQPSLDLLATQIRAQVGPTVWGGSFVDHANGGALVIWATDPRPVQRFVHERRPKDLVRIKLAAHSLRDLRVIKREIEQQAAAGHELVSAVVNEFRNVVEVQPILKSDGSQSTTSGEVDALRAPYGTATVVSPPQGELIPF